MARAAAAAAPSRASRAKAAHAKTARAGAARAGAAPARHSTRRRPVGSRRAPTRRRVSGAAAAPAIALPVRVINAPFARAARRRTGSLLDALLAGRGWIALVFVLLAGIVFFNVDLLQMNRDIAGDDQKISALKRQIARNRLDVARLASSERIQESAAQMGLVLPAPGDVRYLKAHPRRDGHRAAKRITAPNTAIVPPEPIDTTPEPVSPTGTEAATTVPPATDPTTTDTSAAPTTTTDPAAADPAAADPGAAQAPTTTAATPAG